MLSTIAAMEKCITIMLNNADNCAAQCNNPLSPFLTNSRFYVFLIPRCLHYLPTSSLQTVDAKTIHLSYKYTHVISRIRFKLKVEQKERNVSCIVHAIFMHDAITKQN